MVADDKPAQLYDTQANTAPPTRPQLYGGALPSISQSHVPHKMSITDQLYNAAATAERNSKVRPLDTSSDAHNLGSHDTFCHV